MLSLRDQKLLLLSTLQTAVGLLSAFAAGDIVILPSRISVTTGLKGLGSKQADAVSCVYACFSFYMWFLIAWKGVSAVWCSSASEAVRIITPAKLLILNWCSLCTVVKLPYQNSPTISLLWLRHVALIKPRVKIRLVNLWNIKVFGHVHRGDDASGIVSRCF